MLKVLSDNFFNSQKLALANKNEAEKFLQRITGQLNIRNVSYLGVDIPQLNASRDYILTTYEKDWVQRYHSQNFQNIDPVANFGLRGILPFDWDDRNKSDAEVERLFHEASSFGVAGQGMSIPIRGAQGERAVFSINCDLTDSDWVDFKRIHTADLTLLAYYYHLATMDMELNDVPQEHHQLAPREIEVLKWAAEGKSAWDTGMILGLSSQTVSFYLRNAMGKLGAVTKTQAVATAIRQELLF